jgi:hypothetical protein
VATEGLDPIVLPSASMVAREAQDLGRCAQDARRENLKLLWLGPAAAPGPKGVGALSQMQLQSEVLDWSLYTNRRKIACLAGMVSIIANGSEAERNTTLHRVVRNRPTASAGE